MKNKVFNPRSFKTILYMSGNLQAMYPHHNVILLESVLLFPLVSGETAVVTLNHNINGQATLFAPVAGDPLDVHALTSTLLLSPNRRHFVKPTLNPEWYKVILVGGINEVDRPALWDVSRDSPVDFWPIIWRKKDMYPRSLLDLYAIIARSGPVWGPETFEELSKAVADYNKLSQLKMGRWERQFKMSKQKVSKINKRVKRPKAVLPPDPPSIKYTPLLWASDYTSTK